MPSSAVYFRMQKRKDTLVHRPIAGPSQHKDFKVLVIGPRGQDRGLRCGISVRNQIRSNKEVQPVKDFICVL
jgi:hypothetical protein